jgi:hypothetical protein
MKDTVRRVAEVVAYVGAAGLVYQWFNKFLRDFGGSAAGRDIAAGRVSPWTSDDRPGAGASSTNEQRD